MPPITSQHVTNWLAGKGDEMTPLIEADLLKKDSIVQEYLDWLAGNKPGQTPRLVRDSFRLMKLESWEEPPSLPLDRAQPPPGRRFLGFGRPSRRSILTAAATILIVAVGWISLLAMWQGNALASDINQLNIAYPLVELVDPPTPPSFAMSPETKRAIIDQLLPTFDHGVNLNGHGTEALMAKGKAFLGRARLLHSRGGTNDDAAALRDLTDAEITFKSTSPTIDRELALADVALSRTAIFGPQRKFQDGVNVIEPILPSLEAAVAKYPQRADAKFRLARLLSNLANCRRGLAITLPATEIKQAYQRLDEAENDLRRAISLVEAILRSGAADEHVEEWLSRLNGNLGLLLLNQVGSKGGGAASEAEKCFERAVEVADKLVGRFPDSLAAQDAQVAAVINLGDGRSALGHFDEAEKVYGRSIVLYDALHAKHPELREFIWGQALARKSLGNVLLQLGRKKEAEDMLKDAKNRYDDLVKLYPNVLEIAAERDDLIRIINGIQ